jgi:purine nucleosidase
LDSVKRILLDCDPGIDDAMALIFALKSSRVKLEGISTIGGNSSINLTTQNALKILEIAGHPEIPVARGIEKPLLKVLEYTGEVHGKDGLGDANLPSPRIKEISLHAVDFIINTIMDNPGEITLVPVGPLTNVAVAFLKEPRLKEKVKEVVIMGGAVTVPGNVTSEAEFNIFADPEAAKIVFHSGMPITLVGLDVTMKTLLTPQYLSEIEKINTPLVRFLGKIVKHYMRFYKEVMGVQGCGMHDPLAIAVAIDKSLVKTRKLYVTVETKGEFTTGKTVADLRNLIKSKAPNLDVCIEVDSKKFLSLFKEALKK